TRFSRDWSSDVCSSDLAGLPAGGEHDPAGDDDRPAAQARVVPLFHRGVERVEIRVQDRRAVTVHGAMLVHMFDKLLSTIRSTEQIGRASCRERAYISGS